MQRRARCAFHKTPQCHSTRTFISTVIWSCVNMELGKENLNMNSSGTKIEFRSQSESGVRRTKEKMSAITAMTMGVWYNCCNRRNEEIFLLLSESTLYHPICHVRQPITMHLYFPKMRDHALHLCGGPFIDPSLKCAATPKPSCRSKIIPRPFAIAFIPFLSHFFPKICHCINKNKGNLIHI